MQGNKSLFVVLLHHRLLHADYHQEGPNSAIFALVNLHT
jgi:hypothetical protein